MKHLQKTALILILALIIGLLSSACGSTKTVSTNPEPRYHYGSQLDFIPNEEVEMVALSEMEYVRPTKEEVEEVSDALYHLAIKASSYESAEDFLKDYYPILTRQRKIECMYYLSYFRHDVDQTDTYYQEEYDYCSGVYSSISDKDYSLMSALAHSSMKEELETLLFGRNFFNDYLEDLHWNDTAYEYYRQMYNLQNKFYTLNYEQKATYNGETKLLNEWLNSDSEEIKYNATCAYIEQNHDELADIYIKLLKAAGKFAHEMGYDNYPAYVYAENYDGDYTTEQTQNFYRYVKTYLAPLAKNLCAKNPDIFNDIEREIYPYPEDIDLKVFLNSACQKMGGLIWEVCRFTTFYELYDCEFTPSKRAAGYSSYIPYYEAPVIFVNPAKYDVPYTVSHEFGHGVDHYYNYDCNKNASTVGEMYSQAMEYLILKYTDAFSEDIRKKSIDYKLSQYLLANILGACASAAFEEAAYSLIPNEITAEKLDELYLQIRKDFGLENYYPEDIQAKSWVYRHHTFIQPCYTINYATSVIGSIEICMLEEEKHGKGVKTYEEMIKTTTGMSFAEVFENCPLDNPLEEDSIKAVAEFFKKMLELE